MVVPVVVPSGASATEVMLAVGISRVIPKHYVTRIQNTGSSVSWCMPVLYILPVLPVYPGLLSIASNSSRVCVQMWDRSAAGSQMAQAAQAVEVLGQALYPNESPFPVTHVAFRLEQVGGVHVRQVPACEAGASL